MGKTNLKMPNLPLEPTDYTLNISQQELVNFYVKEWLLKWCKKYHPEAFEEAHKFVKKTMSTLDGS